MIDPTLTTKLAGGLLRRLERLRELCWRLGWAQLGTWAWRVTAQVAHQLGNHDLAVSRADDLVRHHTDGGDLAGAARCLLLRADWSAAPLSGAALLDLSVQESGTSGSDLSPLHESLEATAAPETVRGAREYLDAAESWYRQASCPRGVGLVELHRSGLAFLLDEHTAQAAPQCAAPSPPSQRRHPR